jgi:hypothetical protein
MYGLRVISFWVKYDSIIKELRVRFNGGDWMENFEYLAGEMMKMKRQRSPGACDKNAKMEELITQK